MAVVIDGTAGDINGLTQPLGAGAATASGDLVQKSQTHITSETPCFSVYQTTPQTLTVTTQKVSLQGESWDTANSFDSTTNYRFTPQVAGYYQISGTVQIASAYYLLAQIYKNGSVFVLGSAPASAVISNVSGLVYLNGTTDYVELFVYVGVGVNTVASGTQLQGILVRAA